MLLCSRMLASALARVERHVGLGFWVGRTWMMCT
jgi:hypothetical protein